MSELTINRNNKGQFLKGNTAGQGRRVGAKHRVTTRMLETFEKLELEGKVKSPFEFWMEILNDTVDFTDVTPKDRFTIKLKAAENMAKYLYDHSLGNEEVEAAPTLSPEQIQALKSAFPAFK